MYLLRGGENGLCFKNVLLTIIVQVIASVKAYSSMSNEVLPGLKKFYLI